MDPDAVIRSASLQHPDVSFDEATRDAISATREVNAPSFSMSDPRECFNGTDTLVVFIMPSVPAPPDVEASLHMTREETMSSHVVVNNALSRIKSSRNNRTSSGS